RVRRWRGRDGSGAPPACGRWRRGCWRGSWPVLQVAGDGSTLPLPRAAGTATDGTPGIGQWTAAAGGPRPHTARTPVRLPPGGTIRPGLMAHVAAVLIR